MNLIKNSNHLFANIYLVEYTNGKYYLAIGDKPWKGEHVGIPEWMAMLLLKICK